ncbi:MAG: hypothetical protein ABSG68_15460 [Thermoguttaceae bacterium]|jgi:hypothetical protein
MNKSIPGVIRGNTIQLSENPGFLEGQAVEVVVQAVLPPRVFGEGILKSAGALASEWTEEDDRILEEIYQDRRRESNREIPE